MNNYSQVDELRNTCVNQAFGLYSKCTCSCFLRNNINISWCMV